MSDFLTKEDKIAIISSHKRNLSHRRYNIEMDTLQENAKNAPDATVLETYLLQLAEVDSQLDALDQELVVVNALTE